MGKPGHAIWGGLSLLLFGFAGIAQASDARFAMQGAVLPEAKAADGRFAVVATVQSTATRDSADHRFVLKASPLGDQVCDRIFRSSVERCEIGPC
jgi:hypothetical protein